MRRASLLLLVLACIPIRAATVDERVMVVDDQGRVVEEVTYACGARTCSEQAPTGPYDDPLCSDYDLDEALMQSLERGDASAAELLRVRHASTRTVHQRHLIAAALLGQPNDTPFLNELLAFSEVALRFPRRDDELSPEYLQWCAEHGIADPEDRWSAALDALTRVYEDPRSHATMLRALASEDVWVVEAGIVGLVMQRDVASLPAIEKAMDRFDEPRWTFHLAWLRDERADALAIKYGVDPAEYAEHRAAAEKQP